MLVYLRETAVALLKLLLPPLLLLAAVAFASEAAQVGMTFSSKPLALKFSRLEIVRGLKRILGIRENQQALCWDLPREVLRSLVCALLMGGLTGIYLLRFSSDPLTKPASDSLELVSRLSLVSRELPALLLAWMWILAAVDLLNARKRRLERLRMSMEEFVRELRENEGNPEARGMRRQLHQEMLFQGLLQGLRRARVLIVGTSTCSSRRN